MELKEYLELKGITHAEFGKQIDCSQGFVSLLAAKKRKPSAKLALAIEQVTKGKVSRLEVLYPE